MASIIYLDNAATTSLAPEVFAAMLPYMTDNFGNPSSTYSVGRTARIAIENSRKTVATLLGVKPANICFTSGGTESNNTAIVSAIRDLECTHIITSAVEHHAVLETVKYYGSKNNIPVSLVALTSSGEVVYEDLEAKLKDQRVAGNKCLVSLMHANNEIGTLLDMNRVGELCKRYNAIFHSDCVQTVGHYPMDLKTSGVHFVTGAGHKFHGPKGVGILYMSDEVSLEPLIHGGGQERNKRAGTENVYGIVGFAKALELATHEFEHDSFYIGGLKQYLKQKLSDSIPGVDFNSPEHSLYTVLSVCFPKSTTTESLITDLDIAGICVSGGSACSSGENSGSHVIRALQKINDCSTIRFSFSRYNTMEELYRVIDVLQGVLVPEQKLTVR